MSYLNRQPLSTISNINTQHQYASNQTTKQQSVTTETVVMRQVQSQMPGNAMKRSQSGNIYSSQMATPLHR
jgi:hypothetical protein